MEEKIKYDGKIWTKLYAYVREFRSKILIMMSLMSLVAIVEITYVVLTKYIIDEIIVPKDLTNIWLALCAFLLLTATIVVLVYCFVVIAGKLEASISYKFREEQFYKLQNLPMSYYDKNASGWIISKLGVDTTRISETIAWGIIDLGWSISYVAFLSIIMLIINLKLALIMLMFLPLVSIVTFYLSKKIFHLQREARKVNGIIIGQINDGITGAKTSKTLCREEKNIQEFGETTSRMKRISIKSALFASSNQPFSTIFNGLAMALILVVGGNIVASGEISFGTYVLFISFSKMFFDPISEFTRVYADFVRAQAAAERVIDLIEQEAKILDRPEVVEKYGSIYSKKIENFEPLYGDIEFENVSFHYNTGESILKDFNLKVKRGTRVAIVGETGAGKSTIINLACRFYEPTEGRILIDGRDYKERSTSWLHSNLGYVLQSPFLFTGTVFDNIKYAKPDASVEEVVAAAKTVYAHDFIEKLPDGYSTQIGEGGSLLSTGQKQLISFARAIIAQPPLFVLDEATSSIDTQTELLIQNAIDNVLENKTSFVIAHRLSTIRNADIILVLDKGVVIESGTHDELLKLNGVYAQSYRMAMSADYEGSIVMQQAKA